MKKYNYSSLDIKEVNRYMSNCADYDDLVIKMRVFSSF